MQKNIKISGKDYPIGGNHRAMLIWEAATDKPFALTLASDRLLYLYCLLMAGDDSLDLSFNDFINALDADPTIERQFLSALTAAEDVQKIFEANAKEDAGDGKKKDSARRRSTRS